MGKAGAAVVLAIYAISAVLVAEVYGDAAATPSTICNVKVSDLVECLPAITGKSPPWPTKACCTVVKRANLRCFCSYKTEFSKFGVDPSNAFALPRKCGLRLPPQCKKNSLH